VVYPTQKSQIPKLNAAVTEPRRPVARISYLEAGGAVGRAVQAAGRKIK
jgi:hypothetical protein